MASEEKKRETDETPEERERFALLEAAATIWALRQCSHAEAVSDAKVLLALIDRSKDTPVRDSELKPGETHGRFRPLPGINIWRNKSDGQVAAKSLAAMNEKQSIKRKPREERKHGRFLAIMDPPKSRESDSE